MPSFTTNDVQSAYRNILGRAPTQSEVNSFLPFANTGSVNLSPLNIQQILQATPEYQQSQLKSYGGQLSDTLGQSDSRMLSLAGNQIGQQFAQQGRNQSSSGYVGAFAQAAQNLAMQRQQTLANFYGQGYGNIMQNSTAQGNNALDFGQGQQESSVNWQRQLQLQNIYAQQMNQMNSYNRQSGMNSAFGALGGAALGAGIGSYGGPAGVEAGARIGGGLGAGIGRYSTSTPSFGGY